MLHSCKCLLIKTVQVKASNVFQTHTTYIDTYTNQTFMHTVHRECDTC